MCAQSISEPQSRGGLETSRHLASVSWVSASVSAWKASCTSRPDTHTHAHTRPFAPTGPLKRSVIWHYVDIIRTIYFTKIGILIAIWYAHAARRSTGSLATPSGRRRFVEVDNGSYGRHFSPLFAHHGDIGQRARDVALKRRELLRSLAAAAAAAAAQLLSPLRHPSEQVIEQPGTENCFLKLIQTRNKFGTLGNSRPVGDRKTA